MSHLDDSTFTGANQKIMNATAATDSVSGA